jgi:hypothetical protein
MKWLWQPSFACSYTTHFPQSSITYNFSFKCSHAKISSPFIEHDLILNLFSITSFYRWKCHGELFNITNENLTNKEITHCECHIRMHALSSVKFFFSFFFFFFFFFFIFFFFFFFFFGLGEAWGSLTLLGSLGLGRAQIYL